MTSRTITFGLPVVSTLVSGLLVFIPEFSRERFDLAEQLFLCAGTFALVTLVELLYLSKSSHELKTSEFVSWQVRSDMDQLLAGIRQDFVRLEADSYGDNDVFVDHFQTKLKDTARDISRAANNQELRVWDHHFRSVENVMSAFHGEDDPDYCFVWVIDRGDLLFGQAAWRSYFTLMVTMIRQRQIGRVRTLLVLRDIGQITEAPVNALIAFYGSVRHLECAAIGKADYQQHLIDAQLQRNHVDFGLYGTRLLFLTESYEDPTTGVFCKEPGLIGRYQDFFRTIWNHPVAQKDIPSTVPSVTLDELMRIDDDRAHADTSEGS